MIGDAENAELVARLAHRPEEASPEPRLPITGEWNAPIDTVQADCLSLRNLVRGWIGDAKDEAWRWVPAPMPDDWYPGMESLRE